MNLRTTYKYIYYLFLTFLFCFVLLILVSFFPISGNIKMLSVLSGSMEPAIHTGSVVVEKPESEYKVGDIVTFGKDDTRNVPTTHRIVASRAQGGVLVFTTKGDANNAPDMNEVSFGDVHGKVLFSIPYFGYIIDFVRKPAGLFLVVILPVGVVIFDEVRKIIAEIKKFKKNV